MPFPFFSGITVLIGGGDKVRLCVRDLAEELIKKRLEMPEGCSLEFNATTVEEEPEDDIVTSDDGICHDFVESVS